MCGDSSLKFCFQQKNIQKTYLALARCEALLADERVEAGKTSERGPAPPAGGLEHFMEVMLNFSNIWRTFGRNCIEICGLHRFIFHKKKNKQEVFVKNVMVTGQNGKNETVMAALSSGNGPKMILFSGEALPMRASGQVHPVAPRGAGRARGRGARARRGRAVGPGRGRQLLVLSLSLERRRIGEN